MAAKYVGDGGTVTKFFFVCYREREKKRTTTSTMDFPAELCLPRGWVGMCACCLGRAPAGGVPTEHRRSSIRRWRSYARARFGRGTQAAESFRTARERRSPDDPASSGRLAHFPPRERRSGRIPCSQRCVYGVYRGE